MSIFDPKGGIYIEVDETKYPEQGKEIIYYLHDMMKDPIVVRNLEYEKMLNQEIQEDRRMVQQLKEELKAKEENECEQKRTATLNLKAKGMSISDIASVLSISEEEVTKFFSL